LDPERGPIEKVFDLVKLISTGDATPASARVALEAQADQVAANLDETSKAFQVQPGPETAAACIGASAAVVAEASGEIVLNALETGDRLLLDAALGIFDAVWDKLLDYIAAAEAHDTIAAFTAVAEARSRLPA
jgi:hypothetical protein